MASTLSQQLEAFQKSEQAWDPSRVLLTHNEEVVRYFAAQTFVAKLRAGKVPDPTLEQELLAAITKVRAPRGCSFAWAPHNASHATLQLIVA